MNHSMNRASAKYRTGLNIRFLPLLILCAIMFMMAFASPATASLFENRTGLFLSSDTGFAGGEGGLNAGLHRVYKTFSCDFAPGSLDASKSTSKIVNTTQKQLQKKFKHASDFGVTGNYSKANAKKFNSAVNQHLNAPGTRPIQGTYRGDPVTHHLDPNTGLNVITDQSGNFVSGWRLGPEQLQNVLQHGGLN